MGTDWFFGLHIDPLSLGGKGLVLLLAVLLSGLIGIEREWHGNPAGMRTHILVGVGATLMTLVSVEIGLGVRGGMRGDPGHIAAQIVSGIGFLGAGAIIREGATIRGLTSAASIWATAGIGLALGASPRMGELAVVATGIVLVTLTLLRQVENWCKLRQTLAILDVEVREEDRGPARVLEALSGLGIVVSGVQSQTGQGAPDKSLLGTTRQMRMQVQLPRAFDRNQLNTLLTETKGVVAFHME